MKNIADIQHTEEPFEFDGRPYLFEPEYTDEELAQLTRVGKNETDRQRGNRQMNLLLQAQAKASLQ